MWKPGQLVTLWGDVYQIKKCDRDRKYKVCAFCQQVNGRVPCSLRFDYPVTPNGFGPSNCTCKMPIGCFPRRLK